MRVNDRQQPIRGHLVELRRRITWSAVSVLVCTGAAFAFHKQILLLLMRPAQGFEGVAAGKPIYTEMTEFIGIAMKVSLLAGLFLSLPLVLYQIVMFIAPGLSKAERRYLYVLLPASLFSFLLGAFFGHQVLFPPAVRFLLSFGSEVAEPYIRIGNYTNLMLTLLFWMGIIFEMPILAYFLSKIGVLTSSFLARNRRYAVVIAFIMGALITPTFDPFNQALVALPIIVMYELGIWLAKLGGREESKGRSSVWFRVLRWFIMVVVVLLFIAYGYIAYLMASGVTKAERNPLERNPTEFGLAYEDVEFLSRGGDVSLRGWLIGEAGDGPAVIVVHGLSTNRAHENGLRIARSLFDGGYAVLLFDLRAHGDSAGERVSGGFFEKDDMLGAYDFLVERGVSPGRVGVLGSSMGAAIALLGAPEEPGIRAVVADSSFADVQDLIASETARATIFPRWMVPVFAPGLKSVARVLYGINIGRIAPEKVVGSLGYPVLIIHGEADARIPVEHAVRLRDAAYAGSELWTLPGVEHGDVFDARPDEYVERVMAYFEGQLGPP